MKIGIRADGGCEIGMGHIMRCLALAKEIKKYSNVFFICRTDNPLSIKYSAGINLIRKNGFEIKFIDEERLKEDIIKIDADCIITDSYDVDEEYFDVLKQRFNYSGCFDDENICSFFNVDFLINQNFYGSELKYNVNKDTVMMLGSEFVILRDEFRKINIQKIIKKDIQNIMVTVGGSDNNNNTEKIIKQFLNSQYVLNIVVGSGFNNIDILKKYENNKIILNYNADMKKLMNECDVCISSCGSTIYELIRLGVPLIGIKVIDNQEVLYDYIKNNDLGEASEINNLCNDLQRLTYERRLMLNKKLPKIIDGMGVSKISENIKKIIFK